jgi:predicted nucleotide-binding protein
MARRTNPPPIPQPAVLNADQLRQGVERLTKRLDAVKQFDPRSVRDWNNPPSLEALCADVDDALVRTFGHDSVEYRRYLPAAQYNFYPPFEDGDPVKQLLGDATGFKEKSIGLLAQAVESLKERLSELGDAPNNSPLSPAVPATPSKKVFVVHGHEGEPKQAVARFLESLGFEPVILHEQPNGGRTIIEKFEKNADVGFAVVLLTPDDVGGEKGLVFSMARPRARQNVVFELGYFIGKLGRSRVCALKLGDVEVPSDFSGVVYVPYDSNGAWRQALGQELEEAGYEVDWNKVMRRHSG